jgi:hypothetical protein
MMVRLLKGFDDELLALRVFLFIVCEEDSGLIKRRVLQFHRSNYIIQDAVLFFEFLFE